MSGLSPCFGNDPNGAVLPAGLVELTEQVVRGTWLWPSEKRDLRAEIESHFREGLIELTREGIPLEESINMLRDEFGDPRLAAKLIRRGKKRGRPMIWKIAAVFASVTLGAAGIAGGYGAYLYFGKPNPTVDYVAKMNETVNKTPEQDRAWPIIREVLVQLKPMPAALEAVKSDLPHPGDPLWPDARQWLTMNRMFIPQITAAAMKPVFGYVYDNNQMREFMRERAIVRQTPQESNIGEADPLVPPTLAILLPHLADSRDVGRLLILGARDHLSRGDFTSAWASLDSAVRMGCQFADGLTLIEQLVGAAIAKLAMTEMRSALESHPLTSDQVAAARRSAISTMDVNRFHTNFTGERVFFADVLQYVFTDDGNGNGRLIPTQYAKIVSAGVDPGAAPDTSDAAMITLAAAHADRKETLAKYEELWSRMTEICGLPLYDERRGDADRLIAREIGSKESSRRYALVSAILPSLSRADQILREAQMECEATRTALALAAFRVERIAVPQKLSDLVPAYLPKEPLDIYSGTPLHYRIGADGRPLLYSIGRNMKDDGGSADKPTQPGGIQDQKDILFTGAK